MSHRDIINTLEETGEELLYLREVIYQREVDVPVVKITAFDRFSDRV
jgi:hypothetical protein